MKTLKPYIFSLLIIVLTIVMSSVYLLNEQPQRQFLLGQVETASINVAAKIPGRIETQLVRLGDKVTAGQALLRLATPELEAKREQALAGVNAKQAQLNRVNQGARTQELSALHDQWQQASAAAELANTTAERLELLFSQGLIAQQQRDEAKTKAQSARLASEAAKSQYQLAVEGADNDTKTAAEQDLAAAYGKLAEVEAALKEAEVIAPISGEVSELLLDVGEVAPAGIPAVTLVNPDDQWVVVHLREDKLWQPGQVVAAYVPALQTTMDFAVTWVSPVGKWGTWSASQPGEYELQTFEVHLRPQSQAALRAGMTVKFEVADDFFE
ncbi:HlyD family secretion protein [Salinibius halmophilus]|uniref:HlyD family secretion protein n=1 Tax=Salinibius halmophilus TaxID=1853216 RepID=UPI000E662CD5|nr:HlyD family efflux transporter periplasmic adaptor subunit [Salinibius halmophilus]